LAALPKLKSDERRRGRAAGQAKNKIAGVRVTWPMGPLFKSRGGGGKNRAARIFDRAAFLARPDALHGARGKYDPAKGIRQEHRRGNQSKPRSPDRTFWPPEPIWDWVPAQARARTSVSCSHMKGGRQLRRPQFISMSKRVVLYYGLGAAIGPIVVLS
jgi:hypothetical protein